MSTTTKEDSRRTVYLMGDEIARQWTEDQRAAWSGFVAVSALLKRDHNRELEATHGLSISMVGLLGRLAAAEHHVMRLTDLAERTGLSLSRVSRIVDLLERRELLNRVRCPSDGRAINAQLSDEGLETARAAQTTLRNAVQRDFFDALDGQDVRALASAFELLLGRIDPSADPEEIVGRGDSCDSE
ncbi:MAG TPA: MarR family transcriptional regulator [Solirubrobacteraceae bacterium]|jgi:DNA-binding MarR family transcriptional regulator